MPGCKLTFVCAPRPTSNSAEVAFGKALGPLPPMSFLGSFRRDAPGPAVEREFTERWSFLGCRWLPAFAGLLGRGAGLPSPAQDSGNPKIAPASDKTSRSKSPEGRSRPRIF